LQRGLLRNLELGCMLLVDFDGTAHRLGVCCLIGFLVHADGGQRDGESWPEFFDTQS
jgi:hypothetical protein